jgi:hypothetical protein
MVNSHLAHLKLLYSGRSPRVALFAAHARRFSGGNVEDWLMAPEVQMLCGFEFMSMDGQGRLILVSDWKQVSWRS